MDGLALHTTTARSATPPTLRQNILVERFSHATHGDLTFLARAHVRKLIVESRRPVGVDHARAGEAGDVLAAAARQAQLPQHHIVLALVAGLVRGARRKLDRQAFQKVLRDVIWTVGVEVARVVHLQGVVVGVVHTHAAKVHEGVAGVDGALAVAAEADGSVADGAHVLNRRGA